MLNPLRKSLISLPKSAKTLANHLNNALTKVKGYKIRAKKQPKRVFLGFNNNHGLKFGGLELSNQLELVFNFIDANGDGKISPHELSEFLMCFGEQNEVQGMLKHLDSNGDGFIDLEEYMDVVMTNHHHHDHHDHHGDDHDDGYDGLMEDDLRDAFLVFDCDKNGLISARDLHHVLKRLGFVNCSIKDCNYMIKGVDKDGDGFVNFDEFRLMMMGYINV